MPRNPFADSKDSLRALATLDGAKPAGWEDFKKALMARRDALAGESCFVKDETQSRWLQGRVQELCDILESFSSSRDLLESLNSKKSGRAMGGF